MLYDYFNMEAQVKKYPLVEKALDEICTEIAATIESNMLANSFTMLPAKIVEEVENNFTGTLKEKQALMVGVLYSFAPGHLADGAGGFKALYDAETAAVLDELGACAKKSPYPAHAARAFTAVNICLLPLLAERLKELGVELDSEMIRQARLEQEKKEKLFLPNLGAPALEARYQEVKKAYYDKLEDSVPPLSPWPALPQPPQL